MITLNVNAKEAKIENEVKIAISNIKENAEKGIQLTEVYFGKEIFRECRKKVNKWMEENEVKYTWMILRGPAGYTNSLASGNSRYMKFKLLQ